MGSFLKNRDGLKMKKGRENLEDMGYVNMPSQYISSWAVAGSGNAGVLFLPGSFRDAVPSAANDPPFPPRQRGIGSQGRPQQGQVRSSELLWPSEGDAKTHNTHLLC